MSNKEPIYEYDDKGNLIHYKSFTGGEFWKEYDDNGKLIHHKNSYGYKEWRKYDANGKVKIKYSQDWKYA